MQAHRKHFLSGTGTGEGSVGRGDPYARSAENFFHLQFSVVWIGSRSTFVLCTGPQTRKLASEYNKYYLFIAASY